LSLNKTENLSNSTNETSQTSVTDDGRSFASEFGSGFTQSFLLIFLSEIGDKTFILVMIYSARFKFIVIFLVASFGMCLIHTLSTLIGTAFAQFVPKLATEIIAIILFWLMGGHAIFSSCREYRKRCLRKKAG